MQQPKKNYRLIELAADAYARCKQIDDEGVTVVRTDEWTKHYGQAVVRECARLCRENKLTPSEFTADEILEHFGAFRTTT